MTKRKKAPTKAQLAKRARDKADRRQKAMLTKGAFLRGQGPPVVLTKLPFQKKEVMLRRVDLVMLANSGRWPEPISAQVARIADNGGTHTEKKKPVMKDGALIMPAEEPKKDFHEDLAASIEACAAVTMASVVVPPEPWLNGEIDEHEIDPKDLKPYFVEKDPDEDQVVLRIMPEGGSVGGLETDAGMLHPKDLTWIMSTAYLAGPGGLADMFRKQADAVEEVEPLAADEDAA